MLKKKLIITIIILVVVILAAAVTFFIIRKNHVEYKDLVFDTTKWQYDEANDVYYQIGVTYCTNPEAIDYESFSVYIPGKYMDSVDNGDGTFTCTLNESGEVNGFTSATAPIVIPVKTPGYMALAAEKEYSYEGAETYLDAGLVYVVAGCRGKGNGYDDENLTYSGGTPWGVTDLKAAVRYLRYNGEIMPGDTDSIFTFGMSGGGAQSSLMGATGDSELYFDYLESIGAAMEYNDGKPISDAIAGAMCWCPITALDVADAAYEWNMGQYSTEGTRADGTWTSMLSDDLSAAFAEYINSIGLIDEDGNALKLEESESGIYASGTYYDFVLDAVNKSLNNYFTDNGMITDEVKISYIQGLNIEEVWVTYDETTGLASVSDLKALAKYWKLPTKQVGAFDTLNNTAPENSLFINDDNSRSHFNSTMANLLAENEDEYSEGLGWKASYVSDYQKIFDTTDKIGNKIETRLNMYNPMYYILKSSDGYKTSNVAKHWRIRAGVMQTDTALTTELNLALALEQYEGVELDFAVIWDKAHVEAESSGDFTENFIKWVYECMGN